MTSVVREQQIKGRVTPAPHKRVLKELMTPANTKSERMWVALSIIPKSSSSNYHSHENDEIFYVVSGSGKIKIDGRDYKLGQGSCAHASSMAKHQLINTGRKTLKVLCCISPAFTDAQFKGVTKAR